MRNVTALALNAAFAGANFALAVGHHYTSDIAHVISWVCFAAGAITAIACYYLETHPTPPTTRTLTFDINASELPGVRQALDDAIAREIQKRRIQR